MKQIKVLISTFGPLHIVKASSYITGEGIDLRLIQGWAPKYIHPLLEKTIAKLSGRNNLQNAFLRRRPKELENNILQCSFSEFFIWFLFTLHYKTHLFNYKLVAKLGWWVYGLESCKYIAFADIFHVRSGAGRHSIQKAKRKGMRIIVDHSIAHPNFLNKQLGPEYQRHGLIYKKTETDALSEYFVNDMEDADIVLVNSEFVKHTLITAGIVENKIRVAYLGVREDFCMLKVNYDIFGKLRILFTGGFCIRKGAEYILMSMQELDRRGINYEMIVVGAYDLPSNVASLYHCPNIKYVGAIPQDELKTYLSNADIYLFPTLAEGCASSGMEALAAGLPVITTIESGLPIEHGKDGIIISSKSVNGIVESLLNLSSNAELRKRIGQNAANKITNIYSWNKYSKSLASIYDELITIT